MNKIDLSDPQYGEAMFHFLRCNNEAFDDFCMKSIERDLSVAEYVVYYRRDEFIKYYNSHYDK